MTSADTVRIPVGAVFALVDAADAPAVEGLRWHLCGGYVRHTRRVGPRAENRTEHVWMHRLILAPGDGLEVDHVNGDKLDNRRLNLRATTHAGNMQNRRGGYGTSSHRGVHRRANGRWLAQASLGGRKHHIGVFASEDEAAEAARAWRVTHMGPHAA